MSNVAITAWTMALVTAVPAAALGTGTTTDTASHAPVRPVVSHAAAVTVRQQLAVARYWTPARMRAAARSTGSDGGSPGKGLRWVRGGTVARTTGKVFFTLNRTDYVCSGTAVGSRGGDVVLTAAHCTGDGTGDWASNWTFVPGYTDGTAPYGSYSAHRFYVSRHWAGQPGTSSAKAERYDAAFVTVNSSRPASRRGSGTRRLGQVAHGLAITFGGGALNGRDTYVFGYPSDPPFSGLYPDYCAGPARQTARDAANGVASVSCPMTAGDSGGPWITGFSPRTGTGVIAAVSTYKYSDGSRLLYGTELGSDARSLYEAASTEGQPELAWAPGRASTADYQRG